MGWDSAELWEVFEVEAATEVWMWERSDWIERMTHVQFGLPRRFSLCVSG